jgi:Na+/melibiose symporter-like transporter
MKANMLDASLARSTMVGNHDGILDNMHAPVDPEKNGEGSSHDDGLFGILQFRTALRLAGYLRAWTFPQQRVEVADPQKDDPLNSHVSKLSDIVKYSYAAPQFVVLSLGMTLQVHGTIYYEYLGAPLAYIAFFTAFSRSFDVVSDPLMSWLSDSTRTKWGRRIPYMLGGCWIYALSCILLISPEWFFPTNSNAQCLLEFNNSTNSTEYLPPVKDESEGLALAYWFGAMYVLFYLSDTLCNVPYNALGPELTDSYDERSSLYAVHGYFGVSGTIVGAVGPPLLEELGLEKTLAFSVVGIFLVSYYVLSMINLAHNVSMACVNLGWVGLDWIELNCQLDTNTNNPTNSKAICLTGWVGLGWIGLNCQQDTNTNNPTNSKVTITTSNSNSQPRAGRGT